jgi:hypothetical protein
MNCLALDSHLSTVTPHFSRIGSISQNGNTIRHQRSNMLIVFLSSMVYTEAGSAIRTTALDPIRSSMNEDDLP